MILHEIAEKKAVRIARCKQQKDLAQLKKEARNRTRIPLDFYSALKANANISIIAEIKKASPSKGEIRRQFDPIAIAKEYLSSDIQAISILTEEDYFLGKSDHLKEIRPLSPLPLLRKDFIIDEYQIYESFLLGADAILLIAALLDDQTLGRFYRLARSLGLSCLMEVHNQEELDRVLALNARIIGINNRDLNTFHEDIHTTEKLISFLPPGKCIVSESAVKTPADFSYLHALGADGVLIGETFMRADSIRKKIEQFRGLSK